jgi:Fe(3+) dicitrate transport protein
MKPASTPSFVPLRRLAAAATLACTSPFADAQPVGGAGAADAAAPAASAPPAPPANVATVLPTVIVTGTLPRSLEAVPGSSSIVTLRDLEAQRPYSVREALQAVPGVHVVGEDAFGLNLNIGIRGLDPRRTSRTLLLEDGMPIHLAPYSDPSAHYHTPLERVERIEVIKGSGQIVHGPQTVGGVINFVTRPVPRSFGGEAELAAGTRSFSRIGLGVGSGGEWGGWRLDALQRQGDGSRDGSRHTVRDVSAKAEFDLAPSQSVRVKLGYYEEDSNFGEGGLDQARFDADPYQNAFRNDVFELERTAFQALHEVDLGAGAQLATQLYYQKTDRASYRQLDAVVEIEVEDGVAEKELEELRFDEVGSDGTGTVATCPEGIDYTVPGGFEQFAAVCGNQMRPRSYESYGVEPRVQWSHGGFGLRNELVAGVRLHQERINRKRYNGAFATARENSPGTGLRDEFDIETDAVAAYVQNTFFSGDWSVTPGLRYESYEQTNTITHDEFAPVDPAVRSSQRNTELLPGVGATWFGRPGLTLFAGMHRGIAPPRPDANLPPGDADLQKVDPELSTNVEVGMRSRPRRGLQLEATLFQIDFKNQILPGFAVGLGQTFANAGRTVNRGVELAGRADFGTMKDWPDNVYLAGSYTHLDTARFDSDLLSPDFAGEDETSTFVNVRGRRLPYAPRHLLSAQIGYEHASGWDARLGLTHVGEQFSDAVNSVAPAPDGQSGLIPAYTVLNLSANLQLKTQGLSLYASATNLTDRKYLVSRVNGAFAGAPRQVFAGAKLRF